VGFQARLLRCGSSLWLAGFQAGLAGLLPAGLCLWSCPAVFSCQTYASGLVWFWIWQCSWQWPVVKCGREANLLCFGSGESCFLVLVGLSNCDGFAKFYCEPVLHNLLTTCVYKWLRQRSLENMPGSRANLTTDAKI
jgi:hypothetical protein